MEAIVKFKAKTQSQVTAARLAWHAAMVALTPLALAGALAGCAALGPAAPPEQLVSQLATKRWDALVAQDFDKAYSLAAPSYRQLTNADAYKKKKQGVPVKWLSAKVLRVKCEEKKCDVRIEIESKPIVPFTYKGTIASGLDETWVLEGGKWWILESL